MKLVMMELKILLNFNLILYKRIVKEVGHQQIFGLKNKI